MTRFLPRAPEEPGPGPLRLAADLLLLGAGAGHAAMVPLRLLQGQLLHLINPHCLPDNPGVRASGHLPPGQDQGVRVPVSRPPLHPPVHWQAHRHRPQDPGVRCRPSGGKPCNVYHHLDICHHEGSHQGQCDCLSRCGGLLSCQQCYGQSKIVR